MRFGLIFLFLTFSCAGPKTYTDAPGSQCLTSNCAAIDKSLLELQGRIDSAVAAFGPSMASPSDIEWVKRKLTHMVTVDQDIRMVFMKANPELTSEERAYAFQKTAALMLAWDQGTARDLKELLSIHQWIKISVFGAQADSDAWLIVQHADHDPEFQASVLSLLEKLFPAGDTSARNYAYLYDRVAVSFHDSSKRRPQRYGTQGTCVGVGKWEPFEIEDPAHTDERRAAVGLTPLQEYISSFQAVCK